VATNPPLGTPVDFRPVARPGRETLRGAHALIRPLEPNRDAEALYAASAEDPSIWTYLSEGPYKSVEQMRETLSRHALSEDPLFFTLIPLSSGAPAGIASFMRIVPESGVIEIGNIWFGSRLRRTSAATEAIYLLAHHAFDGLGYRRLEWKCDALNEASRRAAERFGFTFEGIFRKHMVVKGRSRDTAWYSIVDDEWPPIRAAFERWLAPGNFDDSGRQRQPLGAFRR
jgi:RimJ/RimL family protein N-acetyltransferase